MFQTVEADVGGGVSDDARDDAALVDDADDRENEDARDVENEGARKERKGREDARRRDTRRGAVNNKSTREKGRGMS